MASKTTTSRTATSHAKPNGKASHRAKPLPAEIVVNSPKPTGRTSIDLPAIEQLQILNENGEVDSRLDPKLFREELLKIHRAMVLTRKLDIRMLNMQRQGEMGTFAPGIGQEATQLGQVYPLTAKDWFAPSYRSFGAQLWRGWSIEQLLLLWDGFFEG